MTVESTRQRDLYKLPWAHKVSSDSLNLVHNGFPAAGSLSDRLPCRKLVESEEAPVEQSTLLWCILGRDIAGGPSLDPLRSSGDAGSVWTDASVEDEGPPATRLALRRARNDDHDAPRPAPSPPRIGAQRCTRSTYGPQTIDWRRWFGPDRHIGRD